MRSVKDDSLDHVPQRYVVWAKELRRVGFAVIEQGSKSPKNVTLVVGHPKEKDMRPCRIELTNGTNVVLSQVVSVSAPGNVTQLHPPFQATGKKEFKVNLTNGDVVTVQETAEVLNKLHESFIAALDRYYERE